MLSDYLNILVLFMVAGLGCLLARLKWLNEESNGAFTKVLLNIALPSTLILSVSNDYTKSEFLTLLPDIVLPTLVILTLMILSFVTAKLLKVQKNETGLFIGLCSMSSTMFFGIPVTIAVYGSHGLPYALMTYASQTVLYWTIGIALLQADSGVKTEKRDIVLKAIKELFNLPLIAFFIGIAILLLGLRLPHFLNDFLSYLGGMTSALAMLIVGSIIYLTGFYKINITRQLAAVIVFRFLIAPATVLSIGYLLSASSDMLKITTLICSLPIPNTTVILAKKYGVNSLFATQSLILSILCYLILLPIILWAVHSI